MSYRALKQGLIPSNYFVPVFRFRLEKVGKNLKPMKVYVALSTAVVLKKDHPVRVA